MDWDWLYIGLVTALPVFGYYGPRLFAFIASLFSGQVVMMKAQDATEEAADRKDVPEAPDHLPRGG